MEMKMVKTSPTGDDYWEIGDRLAFICERGLRDVLEVPKVTETIYACLSRTEPTHDHWFNMAKHKGINWMDDEESKLLDFDFQIWLRDAYKVGYRYLTIKYTEI